MNQTSQPSLIETMRAQADRQIPLLPYHLRRLEHSALALGYVYPGRDAIVSALSASLEATAPAGIDSRVRLLLNPSGQLSIETAALPALQGIPFIALARAPLESAEPLLQHKTTHRPWYDETTQWLSHHPDFFDLIFLNEKGELCEGSRSNIYVFKNGEWLTPPLSCGLLGGVRRTQLIETGQVKEAILTPADLAADQTGKTPIRLSNALRGWFDVQLSPSVLPGHFLP
ncbi:aminotransferase class IV family protein [Zwartia vadi]|uniref:aminotransferase class IV family protein n=1 Tax=Zwartia vadi TaxID=3058168 RepID=UPI0025B3A151|nr:aminotransferase class IV family protein [Zwartia vadi]MDN3986073.1 aminotransferase class IV family protein [Zwartia vadi]